MIAGLIRVSIAHRAFVLIAALLLAAWGLWSLKATPLDALPDLSDTQVIIRTSFPGQAPQVVEDQVTYPLASTMLSVPGARTVRGFSLFGDSFVYVLFEDGVDLYWARSRVLESLSQVQGRLPRGALPALGPDATGVGWIFQYALVDRTGRHDLGDLRAIQDWFVKYELRSVPDVAEVASVGGMVRQYQVVVDPERLRAFGLGHGRVVDAIRNANRETGGSVVELGEAEYMVRARGYLATLDDFRNIPLSTSNAGVVVRLGDVARVQIGPEMRRGVAELDGEGEVAGGIVVMRSGRNALATIAAIKERLAAIEAGLPPGVEIIITYDRSGLIERAVANLRDRLVEEFAVIAIVCALFLLHLRSALVAVVALPLGILAAFIVMRWQGINANIMSLGGIAIAIGAMVDAAVVMVENAHKHIEAFRHRHPGQAIDGARRAALIQEAAVEVGPALFFSLLIVTVSFIPVFALEAQEGRLFAPLAFTKTYAMAAAAGLSITLIPVLMVYLLRGRLPDERSNPLNRALIALYRPLLRTSLRHPVPALLIAVAIGASAILPLRQLGSEFLPAMDEGDLLYMPSALPGISIAKAGELLQLTDRLIRTVPEVAQVFGKAGRAETATDPAPLEMFETTIQFKPREQWRAGMTPERLIEELDRVVRVPGLSNVWVPPIRNRIDMLATGIKSPVGVKVAGPEPDAIDAAAAAVERAVREVPGVSSAFAERLTGGRYIEVTPDPTAAGRFGLEIADIHAVVASAIGGENIGETIEGRRRFPISLRYPRDYRDSLERLRALPVVTPRGSSIVLADVASIAIRDGPPMLKSENGRLSAWVYVDVRGRDLGSAVREMRERVASEVSLPVGVSLAWSGQFEHLERAASRLALVVPMVLVVIFLLLLVALGSAAEAALVMAVVPIALAGGLWFTWWLGHALSVASAIGFIALAGLAAEFGVVMLVYLKGAWQRRLAGGAAPSRGLLFEAVEEGAVLRTRPKAMTVAVILAGLLPILLASGTGSEIMQRIAAPMIGGMITAPLVSLFVIPAAWMLLKSRQMRNQWKEPQVRREAAGSLA